MLKRSLDVMTDGSSAILRRVPALLPILTHRRLVWDLAKRQLREPHAGQALGGIWVLLHPMASIIVYIFLFGVVFRVRLPESFTLDFTTYLLSGLVPWLACQDILVRSATVLTGNADVIKKVQFPTELFIGKTVLASLLTQAIFLLVVILYIFVSKGNVTPTIVFLPVLMLVQFIFFSGLGFTVAILSAYFRDIPELIRLFALVNIYLMPVVYLPEWVPSVFRPILYLNPFSYQVWCFQDAIFYGSLEHVFAWIAFPLLSLATLAIGQWLFVRLKPFLGSVL